jgi:putative spermidine/putrescine transport system permease protein
MSAHSTALRAPRRRPRSRAQLALWIVNALICLFLLAPILIVIVASFSRDAYLTFPPKALSLRWYSEFFNDSDFIDALLVSVKLALAATALSTTVGFFAALAITRSHFRGVEAMRAFVSAPLTVPGIVVGIAMLIYFNRIGLGGTWLSLLLAHIVLTLPYVVLIASAGLQAYNPAVEDVARSLGASRPRVLATITVPLVKGSLLAAAIFAFITSFDEVVVTLFLAGPRTTTLPVAIFQYVEYNSDPSIAAISTLLVAITVAVVLAVDRIVGFTRFL